MANRICPFCKEKVKESATICKHCKSELPALPPPPPKKWYQTWVGFFMILIALGIISNQFGEKTSPTSSQGTSTPSTPSTNKDNISNEIKPTIDEKKALQDSYFGNFRNAKIKKKSGTIKLDVWQPWVQHVNQNFPPQIQKNFLSGPQSLNISFDEIWTAENDEDLTESEKKEYKGQLDILKLYWKDGKIQASTVEKSYTGNPVTGDAISPPAHKITSLHDRSSILKELSN